MSVCVHALPSLHAEPFAFGGFVHTPVVVLHVPTLWHCDCAVHTTGFEPAQTPPWHVSVWVQALPSAQTDPFAFGGFVHAPVVGLHVPTSWHCERAVHVTGFAPVHAPP